MNRVFRVLSLGILGVGLALAQRGVPPQGSLKPILVPKPSNLGQYVRNEDALVALGKALFWDMQVGSDGQTACATCHFHAGADHRLQNQIAAPAASTAAIRPNRTLGFDDFPFRKLVNPLDNRSEVLRNVREVFGSAGVFRRSFLALSGTGEEWLESAPATHFEIEGVKVRQVTNRNTPSVLNAVFYVRNFWDGRASQIFSGATPFGDSDMDFKAWVMRDGRLEQEAVRLENASLASQAVGPVLNDVEMSHGGRTWPQVARKLFGMAPLGRQKVATDDSVLGAMANADGNGLSGDYSYPALIRTAFEPAYWSFEEGDAGGWTQMERNFPLFFGLAIQAYESTLVTADTPFDRFIEGDRGALDALQQQGLRAFQDGRSECLHCHQGPEFSAASFSSFRAAGGNASRVDQLGFFRTGVSPIAEDPGGATVDGFGLALFPNAGANAVRGVFKSPSLRNVELTGPYFHDGGQATLEQVLEFYARRGDFPGDGNLGPGMNGINLNAQDRTSIVAFLKSLTDERVKFERAPFDHPALCVPIGHAAGPGGSLQPAENSPLTAADRWALLPAIGRGGNTVPLQTFEELLRGIGNDGSRAHTLTDSCAP